jgi:hypothetical protein
MAQRVRGHCCIEAKGVLAMAQRGKAGSSDALENHHNRASGVLLRGFWVAKWTSSGAPIA